MHNSCTPKRTGKLIFVAGLILAIQMFSLTVLPAELVGLPTDPDAKPDFSGSWQKDYRRSDEWEKQVDLKISEIRRQAERQSDRQGGVSGSVGGVSVGGQGRSGTTIIDLARFVESISRYNDLYIFQTDSEIRIKRDGEADLICGLGDVPIRTSSNQYGSEVCGWNNDQLIFVISLPDGIGIYHRFVVSPDGQSINLQTRVSSNQSLSFDLVQFFNRYDTQTGAYTCRQTLTRGKVCSQSLPNNRD